MVFNCEIYTVCVAGPLASTAEASGGSSKKVYLNLVVYFCNMPMYLCNV